MYLAVKSSQLPMGKTVNDPDCRFTLPELAVVVVTVSKAELIILTALEASEAAFLFLFAVVALSMASWIFALAASILSTGLDGVVVVGGSAVVELPILVGVVVVLEVVIVVESILLDEG